MRHPIAVLVLLATTVPVVAEPIGCGQREFIDSCAVCHGKDGKGHGPQAERLQKPPADLTRLAEKNGGDFPYWRVFSVIDGRYIVQAHGARDMPVWGRRFLPGDQDAYGPLGGEAMTQERIHQLTEYIQTLQR